MINLNKEEIRTDGFQHKPQVDYSTKSKEIECYFKDIEKNLIEKINEADIILGCVAWLTNFNILKALSNKLAVSLIINKEDFIRPDNGATSNFKDKLYLAYNKLPSGLSRIFTSYMVGKNEVDSYLGSMSVCCTPSIEPVRVMGYFNKDRNSPRCHHKFIVFCRKRKRGQYKIINAYAVWTGSYNFTKNSENSIENALYITDQEIVKAYLLEWSQIAALSEPLDWTCEYVEPEWRIGT